MSESEQEYFQARAAERDREQALHDALSVGGEVSEAARLVRISPAPDGKGNMEAWVERRLQGETGSVMFARWSTARKAAARFEVRYAYSLVDGASRLYHKGFAWDVDTTLRLVGAPRELEAVDVSSARQTPGPKRLRRIREAEASIE